MDDFRSQLTALIDEIVAAGQEPSFLVADLEGIDHIKKAHGAESFDKFRGAAVDAITSAGRGCDAFTYGDDRMVAVLVGFGRLQTFSMIDKLRRSLPLLAQSFDCTLAPQFDIIEYDAEAGVGGIILQLVRRPRLQSEAA
jgi:hypothetical protein